MSQAVSNLKLFILLAIISFLIAFLDFFNFLDLPKKLVSYITNPISFGLYDTKQNIGRQFYFVFQSRYASQENKALKEQLAQLLSENTVLKKRLAEAQTQLEQFQFISPSTYNLVAARPIGLDRFLKIDKGLDDGIKENQAVVFKDNFVGIVKQVNPKTASVQLLEDPDSKIAAFSQSLSGRSKGVVIGQFGTEGLMDKILHEEVVETGDLVYSEGLEGFLPRGLILGKVTEVKELPNEVFKQAKIKPVFDISDLELVFVLVD
ncbi:rod shape-determining protein MreC [Candidatus Daviesbacteria bacterium]|nr:rod shape-determining protein MreC [Candidatus Daviesbacteria bacterium]